MKLRGSGEDGGRGAERSQTPRVSVGGLEGRGGCGCVPQASAPHALLSPLSAQEASVVSQLQPRKAGKPDEAKPWLHQDQMHRSTTWTLAPRPPSVEIRTLTVA